jgi:AmpD protein
MKIDAETGLLDSARQVESPNYDSRPDDANPDLIIIHGISLPPEKYGGPWIDQLFTNSLNPNEHPYFQEIYQFEVSSHVLIRRTGEIVQYVPFHMRAWHAGKSNYQGRERCNDFSIGIELEGCDDQPYDDSQYPPLAALINTLIEVYPSLSMKQIVGHCDVAPGRKTDPGPCFDWQKLHHLLGNGIYT